VVVVVCHWQPAQELAQLVGQLLEEVPRTGVGRLLRRGCCGELEALIKLLRTSAENQWTPVTRLLPRALDTRAADLAACLTVFVVRPAPVRPMEILVTTWGDTGAVQAISDVAWS
jgi:hypothetical protein